MAGSALLVTLDASIREKVSTVFEFIDVPVQTVTSQDDMLGVVEDQTDLVIALLAVGSETDAAPYVALLNKARPSLSIFLLDRDAEEKAGTPRGVSGYLSYPIQYRTLLGILRNAEKQGRRSIRSFAEPSVSLTGQSPQLKEIQALIRHVALTDANVLLLGESGTGKEVVARSVHHLSLRTDHPFIAVNCGAIPPELLESELFGHEKGAFTGAISTRKGRFELAEGGTLFLDEIGDMPLPMQVKLLRVLQERCFERVGGTKTIHSNVRLIAATHQDLEKKIGEGKFRMDLYYRLNVFPIELPPLRDRPGDIPMLIKEFATRMELEHRSPVLFDDSAIVALARHPLPGNVRELENLVERLAILYPGETITNQKLPLRYQAPGSSAESVISVQDSPIAMQYSERSNEAAAAATPQLDLNAGIDLKQYLNDLEKNIIESALQNADWVVAKAAKTLALQRTTLVEKIKKFAIQSPT
jgi:sigma-54 specific flagellar transcriptional regulator A